jgi:hypothetical protein
MKIETSKICFFVLVSMALSIPLSCSSSSKPKDFHTLSALRGSFHGDNIQEFKFSLQHGRQYPQHRLIVYNLLFPKTGAANDKEYLIGELVVRRPADGDLYFWWIRDANISDPQVIASYQAPVGQTR